MDRSGVLFPNIIESQDELDTQTLLGLESSSSIYLNSYSKDSFEEESSSYDNSKDISNSVNDYVKSEHDEDKFFSFGSSIKTEVITECLLRAISSSSINDIGPVFTGLQLPTSESGKPSIKRGPGRPRKDKFEGIPLIKALSELTTRKRGPKPKIRGIFSTPGLQRPSTETPSIKVKDEPGVENRLVLCSAKDDFVLEQDVCVMCGAFGNDHEGCLISCSQCGQCYHPYCVNVKVTKVILQKGWRCLDCTVCEGCGQIHDEARLILCDDCDISFHIYCMNPALENVPQGNWRCRWCAVCNVCGSNDPGVNCTWHKNYTLCGPCNSYNSCPVCSNGYTEGELIIACSKCDRWLHTNCDSITSDDEAEKCTELGYTCILCRPKDLPPPHLLPSPLPAILKTPSRSTDLSKARSQSQFSVDGVVLSNSGMTFIRNLSLDTARKKRKKMPNPSDMEAGILAAIESVVSGYTKFDGDKSAEEGGDKDLKRRGRNAQKFGIGGFFARIRGPRQKDDDYDGSNDNQIIGESGDKPKRKPARRKVKNKYTEIFPAYLQEAFFGKPLLDTNREIDSTTGADDLNSDGDISTSLAQQSTIKLANEEVQVLEGMKGRKDPETSKLPKAEAESCDTKKSVKPHVKMEEESDELQDIIPLEGDLLDNELVNTIMNDSDDISKVHESLDDLASVRDLVGDGELNMDHGGEEGNHKDELEFLSSQLNFGSGLPSMDSKDVEDIFKGVLTEDSQEAPEPLFSHLSNSLPPQSINPAPTMPPKTIPAIPSPSIINHPPVLQSVQSSSNLPRGNPINQNVTQGLASPLNFPPPSPYHSEYSNSPQFSPAFSEPPSPWPQPQGDTEIETPNNYNQRSLLKWEVDESLGLSATISAVLYCNMNHPELKRDHPNWNERSKQISKIWRSLPTDKRAPYLQKARENRAASRIQKAQQIPVENKPTNNPTPPINAQSLATLDNSSCSNGPTAGKMINNDRTSATPENPPSLMVPQTVAPAVSTANQPQRCFAAVATTSLSSSSKLASPQKISKMFPIVQPKDLITNKPDLTIKCSSIADQQIRVFTPSEIMRTLPGLSEDTYNFNNTLEQDIKLMPPVTSKVGRTETVEERQWKQMQAFRQQQAHQQQMALQDHRVSIDQKPDLGSNNLGSPKHQYSTGIVSQGQRHLSGDMIPQPLQVSTNNPQDVLSAPLSSPHLQSPTARQVQFSSMTQQTRMRPPNLEMPPPSPSPHYSPRPSMPQQNSPLMCRSPMYSRISYIQSPRQQVGNVGDPYENAPMTPQQYSHPATPRPVNDNESLNASPETYQQQRGSTDGYGHQSGHSNEMDGVASPRTLAPQGQETRQHLRDLLQRQQLKKVDQEHGSSIPGEINSAPVTQRTLSRPQADDWHKQGGIDNNMGTKQAELSSPTSPAPQQTQFRHPYMVSQVRSGKPQTQPQVIQGRPAEFRPNTDARVRLILQQHQSQSRPIPPPSRGQTFAIQQQHLASQQQPQYRTTPSYESPGKRLEGETMEMNSSMLAQQLGRPLNPEMSERMVQPGKVLPAQHPQPTNPSQSISQGLTNSGINSSQAESEHQELPDSVTEELEKLEQEQHHETGGDVDAGELADLGMDDDELLGMGADFNILEYADPELNNVVGEKTNILDDNLDLEEEKDDVKDEDKRKDDERHVKRENHTLRDTYSTSSAPTLSQTGSTEPPSSSSQVHIGPTNPEYMQVQSQQSATSSDAILRPPPPPPYPGPPPPYPGRQQQVGSSNGVGGMSLQSVSVSPMMNSIFKNTESGNGNSRRSQQTLTTMNSNPIMTAHQRRTLLLQEQPLLLEDLLEQEKREQQRQGPALLGNVGEEPLLSDFDFERLKADVLSSSSLPVSLSPPNLPVGQGVICQQPPNINRTMSAPASQQQQQVLRDNEWMSDPTSRSQNVLGPMFSGGPGPNVVASQQSQHTSPQSRGQPFPMPSVPPPPVPPEHPITEQDRQMQVQYEQWLFHQQNVLTMQMKFFETEVAKLRKVKKALNTKQRQLRKNSNELNETDAQELERITKELSSIQKQLEQSRKQNRQHGAVVQEYKNKQLKRQQMLGMNQPFNPVPSPGQVVIPSQSSPHQTSQSPLHSTPQSPMLSPALIGSPMASPLAPSPGSGLAQQSGRGGLQSVHHLDDRPFSPNNETPMRPLPSPSGLMGSGRMTMQQPGAQLRMGNPVNIQMGQTHTMGMNMNQAGSQQQILINRGLVSNVPHQQRPMYMDGSAMNQQRMRAATNVDQLRMSSMQARMPRSGIAQEMLMRARMSNQAQFQNPNPPQMVKPSGMNHYQDVQRVPFPSQSPTGGMIANLRSPSPLAQMCGLGSPTGNQGIMGQNRVSPASSPMRRPSGNQGMGSPLPDRPRSVENPLTPRSSGSGPHTPNGVQNMKNMGMDGLPGTPHSMCRGDLSNSGISSLDDFGHFNQSPNVPTSYMSQPMNSQNLQQHGGGGVNSHIIPFPTFSWFGGPNQMGLKGGNPFSVVNGETHASAPLPTESTRTSMDSSNSGLDPTTNSSPVEVPTNSQTTNANATNSSGESQNALLKQLLQNTACASMGQAATEPPSFSLSNCLQARPQTSAPTLTSHLSEAATRIPQPTPVIRTQDSPSPTPRPLIKAEKTDVPSVSTPPEKVMPQETPVIFAIQIEEPTQTVEQPREIVLKDSPKEASQSSSLAETIDGVASDKTELDPTIFELRRNDDEARKAKRRQYQAKRRQSMGKEASAPKKRARKGSKIEEDYDGFIDTLMTQLRQLPPVGIVEPELGKNYTVCPVPGPPDLSKYNLKLLKSNQGELEGAFGNSKIKHRADFYSARPYGDEMPMKEPKPASAHRGFYNQEFAVPKLGLPVDRSASRAPSPLRDCESPDSIVSASSPEYFGPDKDLYSELKPVDDKDPNSVERTISPFYGSLNPIPVKPIPIRPIYGIKQEENNKENKNGANDILLIKSRGATPLRENGHVQVTLTLAANVVDDVSGILRNLANILSINSPCVYQVAEKASTSPSHKQCVFTYKSKDGKEAIDIQSILNGAAKFCRHCDVVVLTNIIRKKSTDFPGVPVSKEELGEGSDDFCFCSSSCLMQFSMTHGVTAVSENKVGAVVAHPSDNESLNKEKKKGTENLRKTKDKINLEKLTNHLMKFKSEVASVNASPEPLPKRWKGIKYKQWSSSLFPPQKYKKPNEKELTEMLFRMGITVSPPRINSDTRYCLFCHQYGDSVSDGPARLLNFDVDKWVHLNCALWSDEVYETENGALVNVEIALKQSASSTCLACNQLGATVKCFKVRCSSQYHLGCAVKENCVFYKNKTVYCQDHIPKGEKDNELSPISVFRRVYVQRDENKQVAAVMHYVDQEHLLRVGSLIFLSVGQLLPHQLAAFHTRNFIFPIGYKIIRFYWSMTKINKRCQYICSIHEIEGKPEFRIAVTEEATKESIIKSDTAQGAWHQVLDAIVKLRTAADTIKVFPKFISGEDLFGLTEPAIVKVLESLPGVETLTDYHFKYGRNPLLELPLAINPTGCARAEPKLRTHFKRPHTQRTGSTSRSTCSTFTFVSNEAICPYSKQFVHSKSAQYKKMKQDWRNNVYLARSKIQGLGLYAARDIEKHTMVIEYIGEIIRSDLAEHREKRYEAQNRGIYMFRIDEKRVIDATLCGGLARYVNHSCNPNCVAEQVEVERDMRIIIFANRRISRGEELSYDYKFEFEDDQHKIPCLCGAPNCRKWMN